MTPTASTPAQLAEAIALAEREVAALNETANKLPILQYKQQVVTAGIHLQTHTREQLQAVVDGIAEAHAARDVLPVKLGALAQLKTELADAEGFQRRRSCEELAALFDQRKRDYDAAQQALLEQFRVLHQLHTDYLGRTGRPLLHAADYLIDLPATRGKFDSTAFRSGQIVAGV